MLGENALIQILIAFSGALIFFVLSYIGFADKIFYFLVMLIPFEPLASKYGSLNVGLWYILGISVFLNRSILKEKVSYMRPVWAGFGALLFMYVSLFLLNYKPLTVLKAAYLFGLGSNVILFYLITVFIKTKDDFHRLAKSLVACNVIALFYSFLQAIAGATQIIPFGIKEFAFGANRYQHDGADRRLTGPFVGPGVMAEYLVLMIFFLLFYRITTKRYPRLIPILIFGDLCTMIATGNRGGFLVLICGFLLFAFLFKDMVDIKKSFVLGMMGVFLLGGASYFVYKYSDFNILYERLAETEVEDGVPDTRSKLWPTMFGEVMEKAPFFGTGVRLILRGDIVSDSGKVSAPALVSKVRGYPHSLYLYIFYTCGLFGLAIYSLFFVLVVKAMISGTKARSPDLFFDKAARFSLFILILFLVDQIKIEFLRHNYVDYQNFITALFGSLLMVQYINRKSMGSNPIQHEKQN